jgi:hypothetical protein
MECKTPSIIVISSRSLPHIDGFSVLVDLPMKNNITTILIWNEQFIVDSLR